MKQIIQLLVAFLYANLILSCSTKSNQSSELNNTSDTSLLTSYVTSTTTEESLAENPTLSKKDTSSLIEKDKATIDSADNHIPDDLVASIENDSLLKVDEKSFDIVENYLVGDWIVSVGELRYPITFNADNSVSHTIFNQSGIWKLFTERTSLYLQITSSQIPNDGFSNFVVTGVNTSRIELEKSTYNNNTGNVYIEKFRLDKSSPVNQSSNLSEFDLLIGFLGNYFCAPAPKEIFSRLSKKYFQFPEIYGEVFLFENEDYIVLPVVINKSEHHETLVVLDKKNETLSDQKIYSDPYNEVFSRDFESNSNNEKVRFIVSSIWDEGIEGADVFELDSNGKLVLVKTIGGGAK